MDFSFSSQKATEANTVPAAQAPSYSYASRVDMDSGPDMLKVIALIGLLCVVLFGVGSYMYLKYIAGRVDAKKSMIAQQDAALGGLPIQAMKSLSDRINAVDSLIATHPYATTLFALLETSIENGVTYTALELSEQSESGYSVSLTGTAPNYRTIIEQLDTLRAAPYNSFVPRIELSSLNPDKAGGVSFSIRFPVTIKGVSSDRVSAGVAQESMINVPQAEATSPITPAPQSQAPVTGTTDTVDLPRTQGAVTPGVAPQPVGTGASGATQVRPTSPRAVTAPTGAQSQ